MQVDNSHIRRQDRLLGEERILEILRDGEYGFLSMVGEVVSGEPGYQRGPAGYGIPINFVMAGRYLYFHCAPKGEKLRFLKDNPACTFCVVGRTEVQPGKFSTGYESVIVHGKVQVVEDDGERMDALALILQKYSPDHYETGLKYSRASFDRVTILRFDMDLLTGKTKNIW